MLNGKVNYKGFHYLKKIPQINYNDQVGKAKKVCDNVEESRKQ